MVLSVSNNDETRQEFDDAIHKCMEYEKEHDIPDEEKGAQELRFRQY